MNMPEEQYQYYIFISYSRKDSKAAAYLQRKLEHFRIPAKLVEPEYRPGNSKYLRPVFRDKRDLKNTENSFTEDIQFALQKSRFLLVLCSPNSVDSTWVNTEINHFLTTHDNDYRKIVPVVLSGRPGCGDTDECLPPALRVNAITSRNLPTMIPDDGDSEKEGWENGFIQALSFMLKVDRTKIKASVDKERLRRMRINMIIGICVSIVFAILTVWAIRAERIAERNRISAEENEKKAKEQADIARKSLLFLRNVFHSIDPVQDGDKDAKVLDVILEKIPEIQNLQPWQLRASVSCDIGGILNHLGEYDKARQLLQDAVNLCEEHHCDNELLVTCYNNFGELNAYTARYDDSLKNHQHALFINQKFFGESHPNVATNYINIGFIYHAQGKYEEALKNYQHALSILRKVFGENHPEIAQSYNNIGVAYAKQGKYEEALVNYQHALSVLRKVFGENHPEISQNYNNIGVTYAKQGKYEEALVNFQSALSIDQKFFGENHPNVATSYNNIGGVYDTQGKYEEALKNYQHALSILRKVFGENHPEIAQSYNNIGVAYAKQGKYEEALVNFQSALFIRKIFFGENHPGVATIYNNIGFVCDAQGKCAEALKNYQHALSIDKKVFGESHPDIAASYNNIGDVYVNQGKYTEAEKYLKLALEIAVEKLGNDHPQTKLYRENLNFVQQQQRQEKNNNGEN